MSNHLLRPIRHLSQRTCSFSSTTAAPASPLFALGALSNSRETQHFNKVSRLSRVEHSPSLKLIQTGEIDQYPLPNHPVKNPSKASRTTTAPDQLPLSSPSSSPTLSTETWDAQALSLGRALLTDHAQTVQTLRTDLLATQERVARQEAVFEAERRAWRDESAKLRSDLRGAGVVVVVAIGVATGLAAWRFWPEGVTRGGDVERSVKGIDERLRARAKSVMPLPAARSAGDVYGTSGGVVPVVSGGGGAVAAVEPGLVVPVQGELDTRRTRTWSTWFKGFFWKQE